MTEKTGLTYKNKPLVRSGDKIYYGDPADKYIVCLTIESKTVNNGQELPDSIQIQLMTTDPTVPRRKRVLKTATKNGLFRSIDIA